MKKIFIYIYVFTLHFVILYMFYNPYFFENQRWRFGLPDLAQRFKEKALYHDISGVVWINKSNRNIILGDSHFRRFDHSSLNGNFINLAIGGQTSEALNNYASRIPIIQSAHNIILLIGVNDFLRNNSRPKDVFNNLKAIYASLNVKEKIYLVTVPPVGQRFQGRLTEKIKIYNQMLRDFCSLKDQCSLIDLYPKLSNHDVLKKDYNIGDDLHLNRQGYKILITMIHNKMAQKNE